MAEHSAIEWCDSTWHPTVGCSVVSPGCTNCYAMKMAHRIEAMHPGSHYAGLTRMVNGQAVWTGEVRAAPSRIFTAPMRWRKPKRVFVNSMSDLFHSDVPDEVIDSVFAVMALAPQHTFQVLTKHPARMREWFFERWQPTPARTICGLHIPAGGESGRMNQIEQACEPLMDQFGLNNTDRDELWTPHGKCLAMEWTWPLSNVWLGVSAEDQARADERIPDLLATPAAVRFVSAEPLLGPVDLTMLHYDGVTNINALAGTHGMTFSADCAQLDWVIVGGESGPNARPSSIKWARSIVAQCKAAGVKIFVKQLGSNTGLNLRDRNGRDWNEWPEDSRVREFPDAIG